MSSDYASQYASLISDEQQTREHALSLLKELETLARRNGIQDDKILEQIHYISESCLLYGQNERIHALRVLINVYGRAMNGGLSRIKNGGMQDQFALILRRVTAWRHYSGKTMHLRTLENIATEAWIANPDPKE